MGILVNQNQIGGSGTSNSSRNIGDIFYTTRTDNSLNGAVECNGSQYNFSDFDSNLQSLFDEGKLPYLPISEFDEMVFNQGGCNSFGYYNNDSSQLKWWRWDEITESGNNILYTLSSEPQVGDLGLNFYGLDENISYTDKLQDYTGSKKTEKITFVGNAPEGTVSDGFDISGRYCVIANDTFFVFSTHNQTKEKPAYDFTSTYFKVPKKLSRVLVRTQKPTVANDYTWYNVYADGWVEQGGYVDVSDSSAVSTTYPIELKDAVCPDVNFVYGFQSELFVEVQQVVSMSTTGFTTRGRAVNDLTKVWENSDFYWRVVGYAASTEYSKDKWNYQNIQVERCMIQLFNSTTDIAVATSNQVLSNISTLNQGDYVIYWDSYEISDHSHAYTGITLEEYQWYRIYKSGWVEQGGFNRTNGSNATRITIPVEMKSVNYTPVIQGRTEENGYMNAQWQVMPVNNTTSSTTTTSFVAQGSITGYNLGFRWQVSGFSFLA